MTTFDTPTGGEGSPSVPAALSAPEPDRPISPLDMLAREVETRESADEELLPVEVAGLGVRLMCTTHVNGNDWQTWQRDSIPRNRRRKANALDLDQVQLMSTVLIRTCQELEYRGGAQGSGDWTVMAGPDGEPLTLESDALLRRFNQMDSVSLVRKLFGNDALLLRAGQQVVDAAGWGDPEADGDENPTG